ncbi:photosystem I reaction center subunit N, chloroplastic-like [Gossypium hirsutum]|uniref:Photosystem I reaction center subunit N, chloroplastic-like n=1 Tax=Gossypium hirsutum TaxID=3635 RepID=A0ABM3BTG3_GOSHI|nr:photosystem I reaction center subunit N, chloroplastic-like [Gossypium hirsutum]
MAAMNSSVLACNYAIPGSGLNAKIPQCFSCFPVLPGGYKLPVIRAQQQGKVSGSKESSGNEGKSCYGIWQLPFSPAAASSANAGSLMITLKRAKLTRS